MVVLNIRLACGLPEKIQLARMKIYFSNYFTRIYILITIIIIDLACVIFKLGFCSTEKQIQLM